MSSTRIRETLRTQFVAETDTTWTDIVSVSSSLVDQDREVPEDVPCMAEREEAAEEEVTDSNANVEDMEQDTELSEDLVVVEEEPVTE